MATEDHSLGIATVAILVLVGVILLIAFFGNKMSPPPPQEVAVKPELPKTEAPKVACPVKLVSPRIVDNAEAEVSATVVNISKDTITAIAFGVTHTDAFGVTHEPYKTELTAEHEIKPGKSRRMNWEILMREPVGWKDKPGSSEMYVSRVAFADGRSLGMLEIERCDFKF